MAIDLNKYLNYLSPARKFTGDLKQRGLISAEDLESAKKQSVVQGLLGAGLSYLAQPKTLGAGSPVPYLARSAITGLEAMDKPFTELQTNILKTDKFQTLERTNKLRQELLNLPKVANDPVLAALANDDPYKLATIMNAEKNIDIFGKSGQDKFTDDSVQESIKIRNEGGSIADQRAALVRIPDTATGSNILKTTYFAKNKKTGKLYPIHFDKLKKIPNRAIVDGENVPVNKTMFGDDGMTYINIGQEGRFTKSIDKMDELEIEINNEDTAIIELADYIKTAGNLPSGLPKLANQASEAIKAFFNVNADEYTEEELMQRLQEGRMQGLLGRLRVETVGGGVMTEQDAYRIVQKLGGDPKTAFNNPARVQKAIGEVMANKYKSYAKKVKQYNDQIERGFGAMGKQAIVPIQIDESLFFGANKDSAIEAMTGKPVTENTNTTNSSPVSGLPFKDSDIDAEMKARGLQ